MTLTLMNRLGWLLDTCRGTGTTPVPISPLDARPATPGSVTFERLHGRDDPRFEALCDLLCRDSTYWRQTQHDPMTPASSASLLAVLPESSRPEQKYLWSLYRDDVLVGCVDVVRGWPAKHTLSLGFLMVDSRFRGQGIGRAVVAQLRERTRAWAEIRRWRIAVVQTRTDSLRFWHAAGFVETGELHQAPGQLAPQVVLERLIGR